MKKQDVLKICAENDFLLDVNMLDFFIKLKKEKIIEIINKLKSIGCSNKILTKKIFNDYKDKLKFEVIFDKKEINSFEIIKNINIKSGKIEIGDFISYFRNRFEKIRDILIKKDVGNFISIRRIGANNGIFWIIGMIYDKKITKNRNLLIEFEDLTGRGFILINRENKELFERSKNLLLDDIVAFKCSGSSKMLFGIDFIYPGADLGVENFGSSDNFVAFGGDFHIGSKNFLEKELIRFVGWLNGEVGDKKQQDLAKKVKYLILVGDNIDGIGVYPNQEKFLEIKGCINQYNKLAEILELIRKDVKIIMCPGVHDAVWIGEPQSVVLEKWGGKLNKLNNLKLVSNPSLVEIAGLKFLFYYGGNLDKFINEIPGFRKKDDFFNIKAIEEILKRRHLAPIYGKMDILLNKNGDDLVLEMLPDVFVIGGQHYAAFENYNNISIISTSCWQSQTDFDKKNKTKVSPCRIPILNLKTKNIKFLDFSNNKIKGNNI